MPRSVIRALNPVEVSGGGTLTEAKELLGHVYAVTTMAYAKVDLVSLRALTVPFGQVPR